MRWPPSSILISPITPTNSLPSLYQRDAISRSTCFTRAIVGRRWAIERELARSPSSLVHPYPIARSRTYCANVWHSRYVHYPSPQNTRGSRWYTYVQPRRRYVRRLEKERSLLREWRIVLSAFSLTLPPITIVATVIFDTICIALDAYYILDGGERLSKWLLSSILLGCNLTDAVISQRSWIRLFYKRYIFLFYNSSFSING